MTYTRHHISDNTVYTVLVEGYWYVEKGRTKHTLETETMAQRTQNKVEDRGMSTYTYYF